MSGRAARAGLWLNLALLVLWPVAWTAPLMRAGMLPWFDGTPVSVLSGIRALWPDERLLALLVAGFGVAAPYLKSLALLLLQLRVLGPGARPVLDALTRMAMADVFLIAVTIVAVKGVGLGRIETDWGLWLFTFCALSAIVASALTPKRGRR